MGMSRREFFAALACLALATTVSHTGEKTIKSIQGVELRGETMVIKCIKMRFDGRGRFMGLGGDCKVVVTL